MPRISAGSLNLCFQRQSNTKVTKKPNHFNLSLRAASVIKRKSRKVWKLPSFKTLYYIETETFQRQAGKGNTIGREPLKQEVLTMLSSSFWQNSALSQLLWQFYCEILRKSRQFLITRHTVRDYFKTWEDQEEGKEEEFRRAQGCQRVSCLLTLSSSLPG